MKDIMLYYYEPCFTHQTRICTKKKELKSKEKAIQINQLINSLRGPHYLSTSAANKVSMYPSYSRFMY